MARSKAPVFYQSAIVSNNEEFIVRRIGRSYYPVPIGSVSDDGTPLPDLPPPEYEVDMIIQFNFIAQGLINGHRIVYLTGNNQVAVASNLDESTTETIVGLAVTAATNATIVLVTVFGPQEFNGWNWNVGPIYLTNDGLLTQTPPTSGVSLQVGKAVNATTMFVDIQEPIYL